MTNRRVRITHDIDPKNDHLRQCRRCGNYYDPRVTATGLFCGPCRVIDKRARDRAREALREAQADADREEVDWAVEEASDEGVKYREELDEKQKEYEDGPIID